MTLSEILEAFNRRVEDVVGLQAWPEPEKILFANQAEREACERAKLLQDIITIPVTAGKETYKLHPKTLEVHSVALDGRFLTGVSRTRLDELHPRGWNTKTGRPELFIDPYQRSLTTFPIPVADGSLEVVFYRYPVEDMANPDDEPEVDERFHFDMIDWMEYLAYSKNDPETQDLEAAKRAAANFASKFGVKIDANVRRQQRDRRSHQVRFNPNW